MFCENCGEKCNDDSAFCPRCGQKMGIQEKTAVVNNPAPVFFDNVTNNKIFVSPDERLIASLGNGYAENLLYKKVKSCKALLTDKRVYFQGAFFSGAGKSLTTHKEEMIVDVEDITGTKFRYSSIPIIKMIISILIPIAVAVLALILDWEIGIPVEIGPDGIYYRYIEIAPYIFGVEVFPVIYSILAFLKGRNTYFMIEYAGGSICFNATIIGLADVRDFQKQIRRVKDALKVKAQ